MPRPVGHGRPGTHVFPPGWAETVASVLDDTHESTVRIGNPGGARTWSDVSRQSVTTAAAPAYDGPASIRPANDTDSSTGLIAAEEQVAVGRYEVTLPHLTTGLSAGQVVLVDASPDASLVGHTLTVDHVEGGDRHATRRLTATLND